MNTEKQFKLEKEFAQKWIEALRSGKYKQGNGFLENKNGKYCCLGVACRMLYPKVKLKGTYYIDSKINHSEKVSKNLEQSMPKLLRGDEDNKFVRIVSGMNDNVVSFEEIANWIEENVEFV